MSPQALLSVYEKVNKQVAPASFMLSVRGYEFGLGLDLSDKAIVNLGGAVDFIKQRLTSRPGTNDWEETELISTQL